MSAGHRIRAALLLVVAFATVLVAAGCAAAHGSDPELLRMRLAAMPGVASATVSVHRSQQGLERSRTAVDLVVVLDEAHRVGVGAGTALDFLLRAGWALGGARPSVLDVAIDDARGEPAFDWEAGVAALGIEDVATPLGPEAGLGRWVLAVDVAGPDDIDGEDAPVGASALGVRLGVWPGALPEPPEGLVVRGGTALAMATMPGSGPPGAYPAMRPAGYHCPLGETPAEGRGPSVVPVSSPWRSPWPADRSRSRRCCPASTTCGRSAPAGSRTCSSMSRTCRVASSP